MRITHKYGCGKNFIFKPTKEQREWVRKGYSIDITCPHCLETSASTVIKKELGIR